MKLQPSLMKKRSKKLDENPPISNVLPNIIGEKDFHFVQETPAPEEAGNLLTDTKKVKEDMKSIFVLVYTGDKTNEKIWSIEPIVIKKSKQRKSRFSIKTKNEFSVENNGIVLDDKKLDYPSFLKNVEVLRSQLIGETQPFPWFKTKNEAIISSNQINNVLKQIKIVPCTVQAESLYDVWSQMIPDLDTFRI